MPIEKTLVFVGAHPDDETFGIGGTLAQYAAAGVKVYYICGTRGEVGSADPQFMQGYASTGDMRWAELKCAAGILGLVDVVHLGYRDSGMPGSPDNRHPQALAAAPVDEVAARLVRVLRDLKPHVVITHDPIGGYRHPDHIAIHNAAVKAFHLCREQRLASEVGGDYKPQKLYYALFPRGLLRMMVRIMPLMGKNPRKFGRNQDIDLVSLTSEHFPVHAIVKLLPQSVKSRTEAANCHASQLGGGGPRPLLFRLSTKITGERDLFMRAYPLFTKGRKEKDLFAGVV